MKRTKTELLWKRLSKELKGLNDNNKTAKRIFNYMCRVGIISILICLFSITYAQQGKVSTDTKNAKISVKGILNGYTKDTLKADADTIAKLKAKMKADSAKNAQDIAKLKNDAKEIKGETDVVADPTAKWWDKIVAITKIIGILLGSLTTLLAIYETFANYLKTIKNISIVRRIMALIPNKRAGGGVHDVLPQAGATPEQTAPKTE